MRLPITPWHTTLPLTGLFGYKGTGPLNQPLNPVLPTSSLVSETSLCWTVTSLLSGVVISRGFISAVRLTITVKQWLTIRQKKEPVLPETKQIQILASERGEIRSVAQMVLTKSSWTLIREAKSTSDFLFWFLTPLFCCYTQTLMPPCAMGDAGSADLIWGREGEKGARSSCYPQLGGGPADHCKIISGDNVKVTERGQTANWIVKVRRASLGVLEADELRRQLGVPGIWGKGL